MDMPLEHQKICVVGLGYVGLTLALTLSDLGFDVVGVDANEERLRSLHAGEPVFYEPGLREALGRALAGGIRLLDHRSGAVGDIYVVSVGTPVRGESKIPDFSDLETAAAQVGNILKTGDLVILRSTVPPGATRDYVIPWLEKRSGLRAGADFFVAFAPERTAEGKALEELRRLPQIVGGLTSECAERAAQLFRRVTPEVIVVRTLENAEMVKIVNNLYRDVTFAFANEIALACDKFNLDSHEIIEAANKGYERSAVPKPSPGVGGYCLTKDPYILLHASRGRGYGLHLVGQARLINKNMPHYVGAQVSGFLDAVGKKSKGAKAFILGLAFKGDPPTSDTRYSPSLKIARILREKGMAVYGYDPVVTAAHLEGGNIVYAGLEDGFRDADAVIVATNSSAFKALDLPALFGLTRKPVLFFDGWKLFDPDAVMKIPGVKYGNLGFNNFRAP